MTDNKPKIILTYKKIEPVINKFIKFAIPLYIEMIEKHKYNLEKYLQFSDYPKINRELINARTTVSQLKFELLELDSLRHQICQSDIPLFDYKIKSTKDNALLTINSFVEFTQSSQLHSLLNKSTDINLDANILKQENATQFPRDTMLLLSKSYNEYNPDIILKNEENCEKLQNELIEVNQIFRDLSQLVHNQGESINKIDENIISATSETDEGIKNLYQAMKYKKSIYPIAGALIGGCVGGPVGLICGLKIGGVAALGGAILGMQGGRLVKKYKTNSYCTLPIFNKVFNKSDKTMNPEMSNDIKKEN